MEKERISNLIADPGMLDKSTLDELKELVRNYPTFQAGWWLYLKNLKQVKSPDFESELKLAAIQILDRKLLYKFLNTNFRKKHNRIELDKFAAEAYQLDGDDKISSGNSLIDKFLSAEPGIIRPKGEPSDEEWTPRAEELAEQSLTENDEIVTETLAMLYFEQKKYDKALNAFRKLSLKYPEKSVYFATRIEEIEKLKNI